MVLLSRFPLGNASKCSVKIKENGGGVNAILIESIKYIMMPSNPFDKIYQEFK
jgi:hypothetical protein